MSGPKTSFPSNPSDTFTRTCYFVCFFFSPLSLKMGPMSTKSWCPLCPPPLVHFCFLSVSLAQHQHQNPDQNPTTHRYTELNMPTCSSGRPPPPPASYATPYFKHHIGMPTCPTDSWPALAAVHLQLQVHLACCCRGGVWGDAR